MREKGAVVGSDTFLARTLISAVRLSGRVDRWEGASCKVGCMRYTQRYLAVSAGRGI